MNKLWCVALAFGDAKDGGLVLTCRLAPSVDVAAAMAVAQYYVEDPGVRLPLTGAASLEITRAFMEEILRRPAENEAKPDPVVRLVPRTISTIDEQMTNLQDPYLPPDAESEL